MKKRPGVMLYFDRLTFLDRLSDEQAGRLFRCILAYAENGVVPEIEDLALGMAWDVIRPVLDYDRERYEAICEKRRQSVQKRWNTNVSSCIPNTNTDPNQTQTQIQTQTETQTHTQPQPESADFSPVVESCESDDGRAALLRLSNLRRKQWEEEKARAENP